VPAQARLLQAIQGAVDAGPAVADQVKTELDGWAKEEPQCALPFAARGELFRRQDRFEAAASEFRSALEIENNYPLAVWGLVQTLLDQSQTDEARFELGKAFPSPAGGKAELPGDEEALVWLQVALADIYAASGAEDEEALEAYEEAAARAPDCPDAHFGRAVLYERLGQLDEAQAAWQRFLELEADTPRAWLVQNGLVVVREENVTNTPFGPENMPAWSPDGTKLAFARGWDGNVWVRDLETGEERAVTTSGLNDQSLDWSPDGRWLLYTKRDGNYTRADLWRVPADGPGEEKPLTKMDTAKLGRWLASGKQIYFEAAGGTYLMDGDAENPAVASFEYGRDLTGPWPAQQPAFSPDGRKAAFYRGSPDGVGQIMLYEQWGEWDRCQALTPEPGRYHYPTFSPDGRFVLFSGRAAAGPFDLFVVPADGSRRPVRLLRCGYEADWGPQARWSPDGRRIAFPRPVFGDIWIATLGGVKTLPLAEGNTPLSPVAHGRKCVSRRVAKGSCPTCEGDLVQIKLISRNFSRGPDAHGNKCHCKEKNRNVETDLLRGIRQTVQTACFPKGDQSVETGLRRGFGRASAGRGFSARRARAGSRRPGAIVAPGAGGPPPDPRGWLETSGGRGPQCFWQRHSAYLLR